MALLKIAIPTFNRSCLLSQQLHLLSHEPGFELIDIEVFDNCSSDDTKSICVSFEEKYKNFRYSCRRSNIGADLNIALSYVAPSSAKWLWILSDNDHIMPGSIAFLLNLVRDYPDAAYMHFVSDWISNRQNVSQTCFTINSLDRFFELGESFEQLLLISANVYNLSIFSAEKKVITSAIYNCCASQLIPLETCHALGYYGLFVVTQLTTQCLVKESSRWSAIDILPKISILWTKQLISKAGIKSIRSYLKRNCIWGYTPQKYLIELLLRVNMGSLTRFGAFAAVCDYVTDYLWVVSIPKCIFFAIFVFPVLLTPLPKPFILFIIRRWNKAFSADYINNPLSYYR